MADSSSDRRLYYGMAYYPEQWPRERWAEDAQRMRETGLNVVRVAEFTWCRLEPTEGTYDLEWLANAVDTLVSKDLKVVLCTPTAAPPAWLVRQYPEIMAVDRDGRRAHFGSRRRYCPNHSTYRRLSEQVVTVLARRFGQTPGVIGWQIDNELSGHCFCPVCQDRFRDWLRQRYDNLDELNRAWGTVFWGQEYGDWEEIPLPLTPPPWSEHNPGLLMDYHRFASASWVGYFKLQSDILHREAPDHWVTTNLLAFPLAEFDYHAMLHEADVAAWDNYHLDPAAGAMGHDLMRGAKRKGFWVLEQQFRRIGPRALGQNRLLAHQAIAHGADGVVHFRWRQAPWGSEQMLPLLFDGDGHPRREYLELKQTADELARLGEHLAGTWVPGEAAVMVSTGVLWTSWTQEWIRDHRYYVDLLLDAYRAFWKLNLPVDLVAPDANLSGYRLVVAPYLCVADEELSRRLEDYVLEGGCLLLTAGSGQKDPSNAFHETVSPGPLRDLVGATVRDAFFHGDSAYKGTIEFTDPPLRGVTGRTHLFTEVLETREANVVGVYRGGILEGMPAVTGRPLGRGQIIYVGTCPSSDLYAGVLGRLGPGLGLRPGLAAPEGVEVCRRVRDEAEYLFVLNHREETKEVTLTESYRDLLHDGVITSQVRLEPYGVFCGVRL
jgi:beta-galactosidase